MWQHTFQAGDSTCKGPEVGAALAVTLVTPEGILESWAPERTEFFLCLLWMSPQPLLGWGVPSLLPGLQRKFSPQHSLPPASQNLLAPCPSGPQSSRVGGYGAAIGIK